MSNTPPPPNRCPHCGRELVQPCVYYTTAELAKLMSMSPSWVVKWRRHIAGAKKIGRVWRFERVVIDSRRARGESIIIKDKLFQAMRRSHINDVYGAARGQKKGVAHGTKKGR
jgi:hypothetical protein